MDHLKPALHATPEQRPLRLARLIKPMQAFVQHAQSGGIVLLVTLLALVIANSSVGPDYLALLEVHAGISIGPYCSTSRCFTGSTMV